MDVTTASLPAQLDRAHDRENPQRTREGQHFFGEDGFNFGDVLDMVNPLQHIPILNGIYRRLTGDDISTGARLAGGAIFGGAIGFASALINSAVDDTTGRDLGEHVMALFWPEANSDEPQQPEAQPTIAAAQEVVPADELNLASALMAMASPVANTTPRMPDTVTPAAPTILAAPTLLAEPAYLSALPPRAPALAAQQENAGLNAQAQVQQALTQPGASTASNAPGLSPAAMSALLASLTGGDIELGEEREEDSRSPARPAQNNDVNDGVDPTSIAANLAANAAVWQAAMSQRLATAP